jgi:hypothetical protein
MPYDKVSDLPAYVQKLPEKVTRLYNKFVVRNASGCWGWSGRLDKDGYAYIDYKEFGLRQIFRAHRVSYMLHKGSLDDSLLVLHQTWCTARSCTNPDCLYQGTAHDNVQDCVNSGRHAGGALCGERNYNATLTDEDVCIIIQRLRSGEKRQALANEYGVAYQTIWKYDKGVSRTPALGVS